MMMVKNDDWNYEEKDNYNFDNHNKDNHNKDNLKASPHQCLSPQQQWWQMQQGKQYWEWLNN